jgi:hypothetical protein
MHAALTIAMVAVWLLVDYPWGLAAFAMLAATPFPTGDKAMDCGVAKCLRKVQYTTNDRSLQWQHLLG